MSEKKQPGMMLYLEDLLTLKDQLSYQQLGILLCAIIDYVTDGIVPEDGCDPLVKMAFGLLRGKMDRDCAKYWEICAKRQYAVYCRERDKTGLPRQSFEQWRECMISSGLLDDRCYPTATATANSNSNSNTTSSSYSTATATRYQPTAQPSTGYRPHYQRLNTPEDDFERKRKAAIKQFLENSGGYDG